MKQAVKNSSQQVSPRLMNPTIRRFKRDWQLHLLAIVPVAWIILFAYVPMYGAQIAFRAYSIEGGISGSDWVGLKYLVEFFKLPSFARIVGNTFWLSLYIIIICFPLPILMALLMNVMRNQLFKKSVQTISYIPHFISTVVMVAILRQVTNPLHGLYGQFYTFLAELEIGSWDVGAWLGLTKNNPTDPFGIPAAFPHLYVWSAVWQNMGWNTIIYLASLSSVSNELHEAAEIDGASRWKRVLHVDLPAILPTVGIMLILRMGSLLSVGFEKTFLMQTDLNNRTSEVISTYVYKQGIQKGGFENQAFGTAVDLLNNVINCAMLILVNWISRKVSHDEVSLF